MMPSLRNARRNRCWAATRASAYGSSSTLASEAAAPVLRPFALSVRLGRLAASGIANCGFVEMMSASGKDE
ncbi:hypothetical protein BCR44DRAFT_1440647 [Catenaria anguillulae PL171]|uniref:Uncharacterized protein n=1 Tax=Catenaria anguillulae PL171 TaxID=765915 RepID=A0A1Y2HH18_9FUNG|nr:hypothetical protein BCR44DRAFT_1440647 [Catenaria anguillulae PL171]